MEKLENVLSKYWFVFIILLSIPAVWALFVPGFFGASDDLHIGFLYEMNRAFSLGEFPPRYVPDLSFQFGYPLFDFEYPFPFYIGELFHIVGFSFVDSIKAVFLISIPLSLMSMYLLLKKISGATLALAGALVYGFTPYRASDIYVRGDIGEAMSFVFFPMLALSFLQIATAEGKKKNIFWIGVGGLTFGLLMLTHEIASYMFIPAAILLALLLIIFVSQKKKTAVVSIIISSVLGFLISIYFWLPALLERNLVKYSTVFNIVDHFPTLKQLLVPFFGYGASVPGPNDGLSFYIGTINLFILSAGVIILFFAWKNISKLEKVILSWSLAFFIASFFMMNNRLNFVWQTIPLLPYFQFPWRFLMMTTFITPIFVISLKYLNIKKILGVALVGLVIVLNWYYFKPHDFLGRQDDYYINRYIPNPVASSAYLQTSEESLLLPVQSEKRPDMIYPRVFSVSDGASIQIQTQNDLNVVMQTAGERAFSLSYSKYYFPGWSAKLDGKNWPLSSGKPFGQISVSIPSGSHTLEIFYQETFLKRFLDIISLLSFLTSLIFILQFKLRSQKG